MVAFGATPKCYLRKINMIKRNNEGYIVISLFGKFIASIDTTTKGNSVFFWEK